MVGTKLGAALLITSMVFAAACSAPASNKTELKVCEAGENGCPAEKEPTAKPKKTTTPDNPETDPDPEPAPRPSTPDAGTDAGTKTFGPSCTKLKACCEAMDAAGWITDFCYESLNTGLESVCYTKFQAYVDDPEGSLPVACNK